MPRDCAAAHMSLGAVLITLLLGLALALEAGISETAEAVIRTHSLHPLPVKQAAAAPTSAAGLRAPSRSARAQAQGQGAVPDKPKPHTQTLLGTTRSIFEPPRLLAMRAERVRRGAAPA